MNLDDLKELTNLTNIPETYPHPPLDTPVSAISIYLILYPTLYPVVLTFPRPDSHMPRNNSPVLPFPRSY